MIYGLQINLPMDVKHELIEIDGMDAIQTTIDIYDQRRVYQTLIHDLKQNNKESEVKNG